jgi:hypothetical protein
MATNEGETLNTGLQAAELIEIMSEISQILIEI